MKKRIKPLVTTLLIALVALITISSPVTQQLLSAGLYTASAYACSCIEIDPPDPASDIIFEH